MSYCPTRHYQIGEPKWENRVLDTYPTYGSWKGMHYRCTKTKNVAYARYGGRGIKVCARWEDYDNFVADMGLRPHGTTLERKNNNGNYEPGNCRWATPKEQGANRRNNKIISYNGISKTAVEWSEFLRVPRHTFYSFVRRKGPVAAIERYSAKGSF